MRIVPSRVYCARCNRAIVTALEGVLYCFNTLARHLAEAHSDEYDRCATCRSAVQTQPLIVCRDHCWPHVLRDVGTQAKLAREKGRPDVFERVEYWRGHGRG